MSRAFVNEDSQVAPPALVPRAPLPPGVVNYVRPQGLAKLQAELAELQAAHATAEQNQADAQARSTALVTLNAKLAELQGRIASARVVRPEDQPANEVRFGAAVMLGTHIQGKAEPERSYTIVGVDEANLRAGLIAFTSPLARVLQGLHPGQKAHLKTGRGEEEIEVLEVRY